MAKKKTAAQDIIAKLEEKEEKEKKKKKGNERSLIQMDKLQKTGVLTGRAQAFRVMKMLAEYLEWKTLAQIIDGKEYLNIQGITTVEDYFEYIGIGKSQGYKTLKAGRALTEEELQFCGVIGLTREDLFSYAYVPEDQRLQIKDGQVVNLGNADKDEIKMLIKKLIDESKAIKDAAIQVAKENETLRAENRGLKARLPNQHGLEWALLAVMRADEHIAGFHSNMNLLLDSRDHRLVRDPEFRAKIIALYETFYRMGIEISHEIEELTGYDPWFAIKDGIKKEANDD